ncbi:hypothetical protein DQ04_00551080 [Trypanosoma grayi]|uniref:hypothetical protein n=1 Tax=Trypanosoma grayi TaxID=71804 RepID=UPI0004F4B6D8|nr:hypothetical protein DQ04_00551080 [Trypanosoma grayi]KEG14256.1 hypothetical protein DQ04_00551080 [Trypanosoma grayi]
MEVAALLARYLRVQSPARADLVAAHQDLFTPDVVEALEGASNVLLQTQRQAKDACRSISSVMDDVDLPMATRLTAKELHDLDVTEETMITRFSETLAALLSEGEMPRVAMHGAPPSACVDRMEFYKPWHQQCPIVMEILSFLPVEYILSVAEVVCRSWQMWLCVPDVSRAFWAGCVQQEFPEMLRTLVASEGPDLYESDWRTIALVCCTQDDDDDDEDEDGASGAPGAEAATQ